MSPVPRSLLEAVVVDIYKKRSSPFAPDVSAGFEKHHPWVIHIVPYQAPGNFKTYSVAAPPKTHKKEPARVFPLFFSLTRTPLGSVLKSSFCAQMTYYTGGWVAQVLAVDSGKRTRGRKEEEGRKCFTRTRPALPPAAAVPPCSARLGKVGASRRSHRVRCC